jgi:dipeptidase E
VKLLLTSGGVTNPSIRSALVDLLGKPIEESDALFVPTAQWGHPACSPQTAWMSTAGRWPGQEGVTQLGWRTVGLLELTALPTIDPGRWKTWVTSADALLVDGGEAIYLSRWIRESGLLDLFPSLVDTVWVGVSAGSMALTPRVGGQFVEGTANGPDEALGVVDFSIFPHLNYPGWDANSAQSAARWAQDIRGASFAIDDQTAISVREGAVEVISEGEWLAFDPS